MAPSIDVLKVKMPVDILELKNSFPKKHRGHSFAQLVSVVLTYLENERGKRALFVQAT